MQTRLLALALAALASFTIFSSTSAKAQAGPMLFAVLLGGNVCVPVSPTITQCQRGQMTAFGTVSFIFPTATSVCAGVTLSAFATVSAAHLHPGKAGVDGINFVDFSPPAGTSAAGNAWGRCVTGISAATVASIKDNPTGWYFDIHTEGEGGRPLGAVRGQLF